MFMAYFLNVFISAVIKSKIESVGMFQCFTRYLKFLILLFSRFPETPQAPVEQREEVTSAHAQTRVWPWRPHSPTKSGTPCPDTLQAPELGSTTKQLAE